MSPAVLRADHLRVYGLTVEYKFHYGTLTGTTNQYNRRLDFNYDSTPILAFLRHPGARRPPRTANARREFERDPLRVRLRLPRQFRGRRVSPTRDATIWTVQVVTTNGDGNPTGPFSPLNSRTLYRTRASATRSSGRQDDRTITQYAGFGEATWTVTPKLHIHRWFALLTAKTSKACSRRLHPFGGFPAGSTGEAPMRTRRSLQQGDLQVQRQLRV